MEFIGRFYCFFESLFGEFLGQYLWGYDCVTDDYTNPNLFPRIAAIVFFISLAICAIYYYVINNTRFNRWWHWVIMLVLNSLVCLLVGYWWIKEDELDSKIPDCLMYGRDENGEIISEYITDSNFWGFALTNAIIAAILFFLISMVIKWWSASCRKTPF
jgi:amino acid transporter